MLRRLRLFVVRTDSNEDHSPALNAGIDDPPKEWRRPRGRPRQPWLRKLTVENDLKQQNLGLWSARHRAYDRERWREIVETATLQQGHMLHDDGTTVRPDFKHWVYRGLEVAKVCC